MKLAALVDRYIATPAARPPMIGQTVSRYRILAKLTVVNPRALLLIQLDRVDEARAVPATPCPTAHGRGSCALNSNSRLEGLAAASR